MASVPVDEETKAELERLRSEIERETGQSISHEELLAQLVQRGFESRSELMGSADDDWEGLSDEEIERFLSGTSDWGVETTEAEIDEILYEEEVLSEFDDE